jgi:hypothetical protein
VNAHGGLLDMPTFPSVGSQVELTNLISGEPHRARVVGIRRSPENRVLGVAIDLLIPSETFWGVNFQLRKTSSELLQLEQTIRNGRIDHRIWIFAMPWTTCARPLGPSKNGRSARSSITTRTR